MPATDRQLAERAQHGDEEAFADLVRRFTPRLFRFFVAGGIRSHDAEDLVQESFIRAHRALDRYDSTWAFSTWLFTIGRRLAANFFRDRKPVVGLVEEADVAVTPPEREEHGVWAVARQHLPRAQFESLWLYYGEGRAIKEIGRILACTTVNVKVRLHRARQRLGEILQRVMPAARPVAIGGEA